MITADWFIFKGNGLQYPMPPKLPPPPSWRRFKGEPLPWLLANNEHDIEQGAKYQASDDERRMVNLALFLRRPLLISGKPGSGKSTLAAAVAYELNLGPVLRWSITTRSSLKDGLYRYDPIARLQESGVPGGNPDIGRFIGLGPLGTALVPHEHPRVLLIDEIDKSDIDLPNDLLNILEEGEFDIPELARLELSKPVAVRPYDDSSLIPVEHGKIRCAAFPLIIMTSNGEREFPPAFLRRCVRLTMKPPGREKLGQIVSARLDLSATDQLQVERLIETFLSRRDHGDRVELATDQLLNAVYMVTQKVDPFEQQALLDALLMPLTNDDWLDPDEQ